jgi:hypothetical protein
MMLESRGGKGGRGDNVEDSAPLAFKNGHNFMDLQKPLVDEPDYLCDSRNLNNFPPQFKLAPTRGCSGD